MSKTSTVYISGPMRGRPQMNFPAFDAARDRLAKMGYTVISPADQDRADNPYADQTTDAEASTPGATRRYMLRHAQLLSKCTHIALLPGWEQSAGATAEYHIAKWIGLKVIDAETGEEAAA